MVNRSLTVVSITARSSPFAVSSLRRSLQPFARVVRLAGRGWTTVDGYQSPILNFLYTMLY